MVSPDLIFFISLSYSNLTSLQSLFHEFLEKDAISSWCVWASGIVHKRARRGVFERYTRLSASPLLPLVGLPQLTNRRHPMPTCFRFWWVLCYFKMACLLWRIICFPYSVVLFENKIVSQSCLYFALLRWSELSLGRVEAFCLSRLGLAKKAGQRRLLFLRVLVSL